MRRERHQHHRRWGRRRVPRVRGAGPQPAPDDVEPLMGAAAFLVTSGRRAPVPGRGPARLPARAARAPQGQRGRSGMNAVSSEQLTIGLAVLAGLGLVLLWVSGARAGRHAERRIREVTRVSGAAVQAVVTAAILAGLQWAAVTWSRHPAVWAVTLGVPALFAGVSLARLLAVTEIVRPLPRRGRGGGRR